MHLSDTALFLQTVSLAGAMSIAASPGQRLMLITDAPPARSLKQETDAASVLIWCRSRLQHGSPDRFPTIALPAQASACWRTG